MKFLIIVALVALTAVSVSARQRQRQRGRSSHRQRGRQIDPGSSDVPYSGSDSGQVPQPSYGGAVPYDGGAAPYDGDAAPYDGGAAPYDGGAAPYDGDAAPYDGGAAPYDGGAAPYDGGAAPYDGGAAPYDGGAAPYDGGAAPYDGGADPYEGNALGADIAAEANDNIAAIDAALALIHEKKDEVLDEVQDLPPVEAQEANVDLQGHIADAIEIAQENPQAQELQPEIVQEKLEDTKADIEGYLQEAKRNQLALDSYGADMSPEEAAIHHQELQKNLELALHATEQNGAAVQEEKAIDAGAPPEEVAQIAPEVVAAGRAMLGRAAGAKPKRQRGRSSKRQRGRSSKRQRGRSFKRGRGRRA